MTETHERSTSAAERKFSWWLPVASIALVEMAVLAWLRPDDSRWDTARRLELAVAGRTETLPAGAADYHFIDQPERLAGIADQLSFSGGTCGLFAPAGQPLHPDTATVELFYFEYEAGNPLFFEDVLGHAPEVCMKASGAILKRVHPVRELSVGGQVLPVRVLEFETPLRSSPLWVYRITWLPPDSPYEAVKDRAMLRRERLRGGLLGNPRPPARVILAGVRNFETEDSAWEAFHSLVGKRLFLRDPNETLLTDS